MGWRMTMRAERPPRRAGRYTAAATTPREADRGVQATENGREINTPDDEIAVPRETGLERRLRKAIVVRGAPREPLDEEGVHTLACRGVRRRVEGFAGQGEGAVGATGRELVSGCGHKLGRTGRRLVHLEIDRKEQFRPNRSAAHAPRGVRGR